MRKKINWKKLLIEKSIKEKVKILTNLEKNKYPRVTRIDFICSILNCEEPHYRQLRRIIDGNGFLCRTCSNKHSLKKTIKTSLMRYGVKNPNQSEEVKKKKIETCLKNYGVPYSMQDIGVFKKRQKSLFSNKEYIFKTGEIVEVQGYEPFALELLEKQGYKYENIKIEGIIIKYNL